MSGKLANKLQNKINESSASEETGIIG